MCVSGPQSLRAATENGNKEMVKYLLSSPTLKDEEGAGRVAIQQSSQREMAI